jgi:hypothetical protein
VDEMTWDRILSYVLGSEYTQILSRLANAPERRTAERPYVKGPARLSRL